MTATRVDGAQFIPTAIGVDSLEQVFMVSLVILSLSKDEP
jgi:hypothetical protein